MRILLTNFGTAGDIQPFVALSHELANHGHQVTIGVPPAAISSIRTEGVSVIPIGPDLHAEQDAINAMWTSDPDSYELPDRMLDRLEPFRRALPQVWTDLSEACREMDMLITGPAQPVARMAHDLTAIPLVSVQLCHFGGNGGEGIRQVGDALINPFRRKLGLAPLRNPLTLDANSPQLSLYAMSRHLAPRRPEWPSHYHLVGFFFGGAMRWRPEPGLIEFLERGPAPVIITFGSMDHDDASALQNLLSEAVQICAVRAVVQERTLRRDEQVTTHLYRTGFAPHEWLFSRAACVVHHGGAGTSAALLRSGKPGVFVPHGSYDQPYWARLAMDARCAGPAIPYRELTADKLAAAIVRTLSDEQMMRNAQDLAPKIEAEGGVRQARVLIEELAAQCGIYSSADGKGRNMKSPVGRRREVFLQQRAIRKQPGKRG